MDVTMRQLLEAGVHFGHQTKRWNPKMARFIFGERNGIYIVDLAKTVAALRKAAAFLQGVAEQGGTFLFVGTKKQAQDTIHAEAARCGAFFVNQRWLGGMMTNFPTIQKSIKRLKYIEKQEQEGTIDRLPKHEQAELLRERDKLSKNLSGIKEMHRIPNAIFIIDPKKEYIAVAEAQRLGIPVVAICDTNCDPDGIDYPVPGNDDAIRAIRLITAVVSDSVIAGRQVLAGAAAGQGEGDEEDLEVAPDVPVGFDREVVGVEKIEKEKQALEAKKR